jgi:SagB-type dehydrogenase family enzyme
MSRRTVELPPAHKDSDMSVEAAMASRRSRRDFSSRPLSLDQMGQLAWCAQGITGPSGRKRTAPSAGATYPLEVLFAVGQGGVNGLEAGVYRYVPGEHHLQKEGDGDIRGDVAAAALGQGFLADAPVDILLAADYARTARRYGDRARRYVHMEIGHVGENIYLQAQALGLDTVAVGAFDDDRLAEVFGLPQNLAPLYLMPVGHAR